MNILTFDIEEWFHILDNPATKGPEQWQNFESRIDYGMEIIYRILEESKSSATFFVVGWIAEKYPHIVKKIADLGFEIGSHTNLHQLVYEQNREVFENDLKSSISSLENISGKKVRSFRAPGFSITAETPWAFETLLANGIEIDCSIFPASRAHGGFSGIGEAKPFRMDCRGMILKEFPINTHKILGRDIIFSGGGYFRLLPGGIIHRLSQNSKYVMTYFHPRDFDADQPLVPGLNRVREFKSYYGLSKTELKLKKWLQKEKFIDLNEADKKLDWENTKLISV